MRKESPDFDFKNVSGNFAGHLDYMIQMKKFTLLFCSCILAAIAVGCKTDIPDVVDASDDEKLAGEVVTVGDPTSPYYKLFVLNEGKWGENNASLDFLRFKDGKYVRNSFKQMNPSIPMGLGDTGNCLAIFYNTGWALMNGSNLVEVFNPYDEKHLQTLSIPSPRMITFDLDWGFAYITSYGDAKYDYTNPEAGQKEGTLYKIGNDSSNKIAILDQVKVGYQPEGVSICGQYIFVANSGGYVAGYDNRVTVIDRATFKVVKNIEVAPNLKYVISDGLNNLWVTTSGDYFSTHSGLYKIDVNSGQVTPPSGDLADVRCSAIGFDPNDNTMYILGTDDEFVWDGSKQHYNLYKVSISGANVVKIPFSVNSDAENMKMPSALMRNAVTREIYITDAGDYQNPGYVYSFSADLKTTNWKAEAGIGASHPALYIRY